MNARSVCTRRRFIKTTALSTAAAGLVGTSLAAGPKANDETKGTPGADGQQIPLKIGVRAASMKMVGDFDVIRTAARVPGILGVELQTTGGNPNLRDWDAVRRYKREAGRWAMHIPSLAGVWDRGVQIHSPEAGESLEKSIRAAEMLGAHVVLAAFFKQNAPDMADEASFGPVVDMLRNTAPVAAEAGVVIGLENSLSPSDNKRLVDLVEHPAVGVYYDLHNMAYYGHGEEAIPGVKLLGKERICMVHVKNGDKLLEEPGPIDWAAAFAALNDIAYEGWYVYESSHGSTADCLADMKRNNAFLNAHVRMPTV
jgi:sugar phosphate isomerase/epimerase